MPIVSRNVTHISFDGSPEWRVTDKMLKDVNGVPFVKLSPIDQTLCRAVAHGHCRIKSKLNLSLTQIPGFIKLRDLRNCLQAEDMLESCQHPAEGAVALFGDSTRRTVKKRKKVSAHEPRNDNAESIALRIEACDDTEWSEAVTIEVIRPVHPCDDIYVKMDVDMIHIILKFIRHWGMEEDDFTKRRAYGSTDHKGIYKNKDGTFTVNLNSKPPEAIMLEDEVDEPEISAGCSSKRKWKKTKTLEAARAALYDGDGMGDEADGGDMADSDGSETPVSRGITDSMGDGHNTDDDDGNGDR